MKLDGILPYARILLEKAVGPGDIAVDATAGNGFDTLFLAKLCGSEGHVYAFDIQNEAIAATSNRLESENLLDRCTLFNTGHQDMKACIPETSFGKVTGAVFNLGYLPGGDKSIVTGAETTISAIVQLLEIMALGGIIVLVIYHGHPEGEVEKEQLLNFVSKLPQEQAHVLQYSFINQINHPPLIIAIEKR
ncbi:class I SAM-dependent methyltransferase [Peribacillus glennii]|uniref:Methyltransferase domain-containing protein n=1 Tax=Peribacillus glennii TaxID=2303991 RepID=A0A372LJI2_9BACI|nr:class I SAM-dependent methyltransferase [Peribacillus glennii]RFU66281.1 methyltransferase domain-containing protein [Peribacillus glennii]